MTPRLTQKKQRFYNKPKRTKTASDWSQFKNIQQQVRQFIRLQRNKYFSNILTVIPQVSLKETNLFGTMSNLRTVTTPELAYCKP